MLALEIVSASAVILAAYGFYKYKTVAGIEAELAKLEPTASADVKALATKIKSLL